MKTQLNKLLVLPALIAALGLVLVPSAQAQFQFSQRVASAASLPEGEPNTGLALDTNANCYVTGWFDSTNNFGGSTLTNQSIGGSDIFVAKYNASGALQWAQQAGQSAGNVNYGRAVGADTNGNIYVTGGYQGPATFGSTNLATTSGEQFFLAKYNATSGALQWVTNSTGGNGLNYGIGLAVDGAGNSYALAVMDWSGTSITFGSITVSRVKNGTTILVLVKYDNTGTAQWAQLFDSDQETYGSKLAVDAAGNVYVRGTFYSDMEVGTSNLLAGTGSTHNMFIAKFTTTGALAWIQAPQGANVGEGGVAVDPAGNVFVSGAFNTTLNFGGGYILTNMANSSAPLGDAFLAKYNSAGVIQWAQSAGGTNGGFYWDIALDAQTNIYVAGGLVSGAAVSKYNPAGTLQGTYPANGPPPNPIGSVVAKCAVDAFGHCYVDGIYQGTTTFGTNALQPQEAYNIFLAQTVNTNNTDVLAVRFTASPTSGQPPLPVQFSSPNVDSDGNTIVGWNWNLGDGATSNVQSPLHGYTNYGAFTPTLIVTNNHGVAVIGLGPQISTSTTMFTFTTNTGTITITGYTGVNAAVTIPDKINGMPVTAIGNSAFYGLGITSVTIGPNVTTIGANAFSGPYVAWFGITGDPLSSLNIPNNVITIGDYAFYGCNNLTNVTIGSNVTTIGAYAFSGLGFDNTSAGDPLSSVTIPNSVVNIGDYAFYGCWRLSSVTIGSGVTNIGQWAFSSYNGYYYGNGGDPLDTVTIPASVVSIGDYAFCGCSLGSVYFQGDAPIADCSVFEYDGWWLPSWFPFVYYLPGTTGWGATYACKLTAPWYLPNPIILGNAYGLGVQSNQFGFTISWATNISVVVQASTNLSNPVWTPLATNALVDGTNYFSDPNWTNYPRRFYRITTP